MEPPRNKQELDTLLGMVTYLAKFTPNLAETTAPLRSLQKKDSEFEWNCEQQTAFDKVKLLVTSAGTLACYDVKEELTLEVNASKHGPGAVLMQEGSLSHLHLNDVDDTHEAFDAQGLANPGLA